MITLTLHGVPVYCSGVAGHFALAHRCDMRMMHTVAGKWRVSTVGRLRATLHGREFYDTVGSGRFGETFVYAVTDCTDEIPEGQTVGIPLVTQGYSENDSRVFERGHLAILDAICRAIADNKGSHEEIAAAVNSLKL